MCGAREGRNNRDSTLVGWLGVGTKFAPTRGHTPRHKENGGMEEKSSALRRCSGSMARNASYDAYVVIGSSFLLFGPLHP